MDLGKFDTITKLTGSLNAKVRAQHEERERKAREKLHSKHSGKQQSLAKLESNVEKLLYEEALVVLGQEVLDKLRSIYN